MSYRIFLIQIPMNNELIEDEYTNRPELDNEYTDRPELDNDEYADMPKLIHEDRIGFDTDYEDD